MYGMSRAIDSVNMAANTETVDLILGTDLSDKLADEFRALLERCQYTTTALFALEMALRDLGDPKGADMMGEFLHIFAEHEAAELDGDDSEPVAQQSSEPQDSPEEQLGDHLYDQKKDDELLDSVK